jgi:hypothetical protein
LDEGCAVRRGRRGSAAAMEDNECGDERKRERERERERERDEFDAGVVRERLRVRWNKRMR